MIGKTSQKAGRKWRIKCEGRWQSKKMHAQ